MCYKPSACSLWLSQKENSVVIINELISKTIGCDRTFFRVKILFGQEITGDGGGRGELLGPTLLARHNLTSKLHSEFSPFSGA